MPAPRDNSNATGHQLYSQTPLHRVVVPTNAAPGELATLANDLGDAALWIAERLSVETAFVRSTDGYEASALYAAVSHELHQIGAELEGETGIKASALGKLDEASYNRLMEQQTRALGLILSQCKSAWVALEARVQVLGEREGGDEIRRVLMPVEQNGKVLPVLRYLAGHMRKAMRIMRDLAANRAWQLGAHSEDTDPAARIMAAIERARQKDGDR